LFTKSRNRPVRFGAQASAPPDPSPAVLPSGEGNEGPPWPPEPAELPELPELLELAAPLELFELLPLSGLLELLELLELPHGSRLDASLFVIEPHPSNVVASAAG
jgi:hypothetical protein